MSDSGKAGRSGGVQVPLPFSPQEQSEFLDILSALERGELTPEQVQKRVMAVYQMGMGSWIRALGEMEPSMISDLAGRVASDLRAVSQQYAQDGDVDAALAPVAAKVRLGSKNTGTLQRELMLLELLAGKNRLFTSAELFELVQVRYPDLKVATFTANLDRLTKSGKISRPRKGHYSASGETAEYRAAVRDELDARGV